MKIDDAIRKVFKEASELPREEFFRLLEEHESGDIAATLIESGAAQIMTDELKSRSQIHRATIQNPGEVIREIESLRTAVATLKKQLVIAELECERLTSDRSAFAEETQQYRDKWLSDQMEIKRLKEECNRVFNVDQNNQSLRRALESAPHPDYCEYWNGDYCEYWNECKCFKAALKQAGET